MIDRPIRLDQRTQASGAPTTVQCNLPQSRTTRAERFLLFISVVALPLQDYFPAVSGMSVMFLIFGALGAYVIVNRQRTLGESWCHPVFIVAYAFIGVCALLEYSSPLSRYEEIIRFLEMIGGAVCVAVLCRDRSALAACLYGYIVAALWVSVILYSTGYGHLQEMQADDFSQASKIRARTFGEKPVGANINALGNLCAQGAIVAFALSLSDRLKHLRILLLGIAGFCLIASFLPMSRGAVVINLVAFAAMLYARGVRFGGALIGVSILCVAVYALVPDVIWSRMAASSKEVGPNESRTLLYTTALDRLPEYVVSGIGAGNFHGKWGLEKGFARNRGDVTIAQGTHNSLLQITIYWGVLGLAMYLWMIWCIYRSFPLQCGRDELSLALLGILVSLGLWLLISHGFYQKSFSLGVGLLIGARQGIWPRGIVSAVEAVDVQKTAVRWSSTHQ